MNLPFKHRIVRDLAWAMGSPQILTVDAEQTLGIAVMPDDWYSIVYNKYQAWLHDLDNNPETLQRWLSRSSTSRLGYYFENLLHFWLKEKISATNIKDHIRIYENKRVLGEFDFLFAPDDGDQPVHWEVAVKFYLQYVHAGSLYWIGPNARDRLDLKLSRLAQHQLRLGKHASADKQLRDMGFDSPLPRAVVKGYLFYPVDSPEAPAQQLPSQINVHHLRGWWTRMPSPNIPRMANNTRWTVLQRLQWLSPFVLNNTDVQHLLLDMAALTDKLQDHFRHSSSSLLIAEMQPARDGQWIEINRGFVVPSGWPGQLEDELESGKTP